MFLYFAVSEILTCSATTLPRHWESTISPAEIQTALGVDLATGAAVSVDP